MKAEINSRNFVTILGWMVTDLHLKGNELIVYAIIHGFSQDGETHFTGSLAYLQEWTGITKKPVIAILKKLQEKGLIEKVDKTVNGVHLCEYKSTPVVEKVHRGGGESTPNIDNNNKSSNEEYISINPLPPTEFSFRAALLSLGVSKEVTDAWLKVRKTKKATNSKIAFEDVAKELRLAQQAGHSADECIKFAVVKSWAGFKWEWMEDCSTRSSRSASGAERNTGKTAVDRLLALGATMFGEPQKPSYDEQ